MHPQSSESEFGHLECQKCMCELMYVVVSLRVVWFLAAYLPSAKNNYIDESNPTTLSHIGGSFWIYPSYILLLGVHIYPSYIPLIYTFPVRKTIPWRYSLLTLLLDARRRPSDKPKPQGKKTFDKPQVEKRLCWGLLVTCLGTGVSKHGLEKKANKKNMLWYMLCIGVWIVTVYNNILYCIIYEYVCLCVCFFVDWWFVW